MQKMAAKSFLKAKTIYGDRFLSAYKCSYDTDISLITEIAPKYWDSFCV